MRKIAVIVDSRTNWAKARSVCEAIKAHPKLELHLIACSAQARAWVEYMDEWRPDFVMATYTNPSADSGFGMVEHSANLLQALGSYLQANRPDVVVALTDRYETLCVAQAAALMNIHVAHIQGGEVTGTIDESIRHAVTKLSHIHFPATELSRERIIALGEDPEYVFNVGCPAVDLLLNVDTTLTSYGGREFLLFMMHPVTTDPEATYIHTRATIDGIRKAWRGIMVTIGPNHDAGHIEVWRAIKDSNIQAMHQLEHAEFVRLIANAKVMVGNSSAGIREAGYFGTPVVDVGIRQYHREKGANVYCAMPYSSSVAYAIQKQLDHGRYPIEFIYGDGKSGQRIADILAEITLPSIQKRLYEGFNNRSYRVHRDKLMPQAE